MTERDDAYERTVYVPAPDRLHDERGAENRETENLLTPYVVVRRVLLLIIPTSFLLGAYWGHSL